MASPIISNWHKPNLGCAQIPVSPNSEGSIGLTFVKELWITGGGALHRVFVGWDGDYLLFRAAQSDACWLNYQH